MEHERGATGQTTNRQVSTGPHWAQRPGGGIAWVGGAAYASGVSGLLANLSLVLFFIFGQSLLGSLSDIGGVPQFALMIPVAVAMNRLLQRRGSAVDWLVMVVGVVTMGATVTLGLLLIGGVLTSDQQMPIITVTIEVVALWLAVAMYRARRKEILPARLAQVGMTVGEALLAGGALVAVSLLLPGPAVLKTLSLGLGIAIGGLGWLALPAWTMWLGRQLVHRAQA